MCSLDSIIVILVVVKLRLASLQKGHFRAPSCPQLNKNLVWIYINNCYKACAMRCLQAQAA